MSYLRTRRGLGAVESYGAPEPPKWINNGRGDMINPAWMEWNDRRTAAQSTPTARVAPTVAGAAAAADFLAKKWAAQAAAKAAADAQKAQVRAALLAAESAAQAAMLAGGGGSVITPGGGQMTVGTPNPVVTVVDKTGTTTQVDTLAPADVPLMQRPIVWAAAAGAAAALYLLLRKPKRATATGGV